jgi:probable HAF family extracellular repeat protein
MRTSHFAAAVAACAGLATIAHADLSLTMITGGPGSSTHQNYGISLSSDGKTVAGQWGPSASPPSGVYRWSQSEGFYDISTLTGSGSNISANGVSNNGVVVGVSDNADGNGEAFHWSPGTGTVGMGDFADGFFFSESGAVNDDGTVIVGTGTDDFSNQAFRWTQSSGMVSLGDFPGTLFARTHANGVSGDGNTITGYGFNSLNQFEAFHWTESTGIVGIGVPTGFDGTRGNAISPSGQYIIGQADHADGIGAFIWDAVNGMQVLGSPTASSPFNIAFDVSDTGVVVGLVDGPAGAQAALWTIDGQFILIQDMLATIPGLSDWTVEAATGISADGNTILLIGYNSLGDYSSALLTIPTPASSALMVLGGLVAARRRR